MPMSDGKDVAYALLIVLNDNKAETQSNFSVTAIQKYRMKYFESGCGEMMKSASRCN